MIRRVDVTTVRPLRHDVLRRGRPAEESTYAQDETAAHLAAYDRDERLVGVATVFPEPYPVTAEPGWRLRGMAVAPDVRGGGYGAALLDAVLDHVRAEGGELLWCNARLGAVGFYERAGLAVDGDAFDVPDAGPHRRMRLVLPPPP